jgi:hypothetical protein
VGEKVEYEADGSGLARHSGAILGAELDEVGVLDLALHCSSSDAAIDQDGKMKALKSTCDCDQKDELRTRTFRGSSAEICR